MKQRKVVSMIGALVVIISAVLLIIGCSQPNSNKGNTGNNSGNISNNGGNTGNNGGNIRQGLEGGVFKPDNQGTEGNTYYMYFSSGVIYEVEQSPGKWEKSNTGATYQGNTIYYREQNTGVMKSMVASITQNGIIVDGNTYTKVTDQNIINTIKTCPSHRIHNRLSFEYIGLL